MVMGITVTSIGVEEATAFLQELPERMFVNAKIEVAAAIANIQEAVSKRLVEGNPMFSHTGALKRSLQIRVTGNNFDELSASVYTTSPYAPIQEHGGVVRAKKKYMRVPGGPYLNIPLRDNKTAAGVMRYSAKDVFLNQHGKLFKSKGGKWFVSGDKGLMFILVKQVEIPARLGMINSAEAEVPDLMARLDNVLFDSRQFYE
jgi:phage gpG-like protein